MMLSRTETRADRTIQFMIEIGADIDAFTVHRVAEVICRPVLGTMVLADRSRRSQGRPTRCRAGRSWRR
jgi:hypothetical protein